MKNDFSNVCSANWVLYTGRRCYANFEEKQVNKALHSTPFNSLLYRDVHMISTMDYIDSK